MAYHSHYPVRGSDQPAPEPPYEHPRSVNVSQSERLVSTVLGSVLAVAALNRRSLPRAALLALGGSLLYRGFSGHCALYRSLGLNTAVPESEAVEIDESLTINRPRSEVYAFWRKLENLPRFMDHLESVSSAGPRTSHWVARAPKGLARLEWDAEIVEDVPDRVIAWRSLAGASIHNAGRVQFADAPDQRGTQVRVQILYRPPAGPLGAAAARLLNPVLSQMIKQEVRRARSLLETGEIATTEGQPSGRA